MCERSCDESGPLLPIRQGDQKVSLERRLPKHLRDDLEPFDTSVSDRLEPMLADRHRERGGLRQTLLLERLAARSPGAAVALLIASDLGLYALGRFGNPALLAELGPEAAVVQEPICLGSTENLAGSDAAGGRMKAEPTAGSPFFSWVWTAPT